MAYWNKITQCIGIVLVGIFLIYPKQVFAQSRAIAKAAQRYEIDAKRTDVDPTSADAMPRSREFLRIDSTYYVGWMFQGIYKADHAADFTGYYNAIPALEKALDLIEQDYAKELKTRSSDFMVYFPVYKFHLDYSRIGYQLRECYANTDNPEAIYKLMKRALKWKFQRELYLDPYNTLSWVTHRYRFKTSKDYSFLKSNIQGNEDLAMRYLDSSMLTIKKNKKYNDGLFMPGYDEADVLGVYHYKCILFSYNLQIDSAMKYYKLMEKKKTLPHNNFANFMNVCGEFREAKKQYELAEENPSRDKRLKEWAYYSSILAINQANTEQSIQLMKNMIQVNGSTPGFGWYQIALARALSYDGQIDLAQKAMVKAKNFKEVHIGTTLGQTHYDFSLQLIQLIQKEQEIAQIKFDNRNWWYTPKALADIAQIKADRLMLQYFIVNQLALNPERDQVIYKLFSTESTINWDEVWYLIKDFSTAYFVKRFEQELKENKRPKVQKYFRLLLAKLKLKQGHLKAAKALIQENLADKTTDPEFEMLFLARNYEVLALVAAESNDITKAQEYTYKAFEYFPTLVSITDLKLPIKYNLSAEATPLKPYLSKLNINTEAPNNYSFNSTINLVKTQSGYQIKLTVLNAKGTTIRTATIPCKKLEEGVKTLALAIKGAHVNKPKEIEKEKR